MADLEKIEAFQRRTYSANRTILGVEPLPLLANYAEILADYEIWLGEAEGGVQGVLILANQQAELLIWSVAVEPALQGKGVGTELLKFAESRARDDDCTSVRLYTASLFEKNISWYRRFGFAIERHEQLPDRTLVHMTKRLT